MLDPQGQDEGIFDYSLLLTPITKYRQALLISTINNMLSFASSTLGFHQLRPQKIE